MRMAKNIPMPVLHIKFFLMVNDQGERKTAKKWSNAFPVDKELDETDIDVLLGVTRDEQATCEADGSLVDYELDL